MTRVRDNWDSIARSEVDQALEFNKRLWLVFTSAVTRDENPLPAPIKSNIANLAVFSFGRMIDMISKPEPQKLSVLITINREIAAGLSARAAGTPAP
jgi:flagellar protein FlaF